MKKLNDYEKQQYQLVKNLISQDLCQLAGQSFVFSEADFKYKNPLLPLGDGQVSGFWHSYGHPVSESLGLMLLPKIEKIINEKLIPTYSYARIYRNGAILKEHRDRPSCEVSVSIQLAAVNVKNKNGWGLTMGDKTFFLSNGDGIVYNGLKVPHKRDELFCEPNGFQVQMFCHYVKANGRFAHWAYDKRIGPGITR